MLFWRRGRDSNPQYGKSNLPSLSLGNDRRIQADRDGDLDYEIRTVLDRTGANESGSAMAHRLKGLDRKRTELTPGTVLVREWERKSHRVMVLADGFAWNGQTYESLSKIAFAITGTRWNGPRFFGLRDKQDLPTSEAWR